MDREERNLTYSGLVIAIILGFLGVIFTVNPSFVEPYAQTVIWILFIAMIGTIAGIGFLFYKSRDKPIVENPAFKNVSIYYTRDDFESKDFYLLKPKYIANMRTKTIYLMPNDFIEKYVRTQLITSRRAYSNEKKLKTELLELDYSFNPDEATLRDLDICCGSSGKLLIMENIDALTLAKLKEKQEQGKLDDYQLIFLYPWRNCLIKMDFPPTKRLLLNHDTRIVRPAPIGDIWLYCDHILDYEIKSKHFPFEKLSWWCFWHGFPWKHFRFNDKRIAIAELLDA